MHTTQGEYTMTRVAGMSTVWMLDGPARTPAPSRRSRSFAPHIAAVLGAAATCSTVAPGLATSGRWCIVVAFGLVAIPLAFASLRRRQSTSRLLIGLVGLALPLVAVAGAVIGTASLPSIVSSRVVPESVLASSPGTVTAPDDGRLPAPQRAEDEQFLSALVMQMQTMHGAWAPYPSSLQISNGSLVEGSGILRGTALGAVPAGIRLQYDVARDGSRFRVTVRSSDHEDVLASAGGSLGAQ